MKLPWKRNKPDIFGGNPAGMRIGGGYIIPHGANPIGNIGGEVIPDKISDTPLTGFRTWFVTLGGAGPGLQSLHRLYYWDRETTAECLPQYGPFSDHKAPDPECACGLYAQLPEHPIEEWASMRVGRVSATGTVQMFGRVIVCERGYKAEKAVIQSPVVLDVSCAKGGCTTDVTKIQLGAPHTSMLGWCPNHSAVLSDEAVTIPSAVWLNQTCQDLAERYSIEFITWQ